MWLFFFNTLVQRYKKFCNHAPFCKKNTKRGRICCNLVITGTELLITPTVNEEIATRISGDVPVDHSYSIFRRVLNGAAVDVLSDKNDFFVTDNMAKIRARIISDTAKEKGEKSEAEYLVVSATIAIFVVENRENGLCIDSQN